MLLKQTALYARVSSERQVEAQTIGSQLTAVRERASADGRPIAPALEFVDDGYSGATLVRPALERLRDLVAVGGVERLYVHSPDRLARKYAHQVLLLDEFARAGVVVVFLNRAVQETAEDELLVQVQGVIAEYERAKIAERGRRGRRHAARLGSLSVLAHAPYGYRYVGKAHGVDPPRYEVVLDQARVVRRVFEWVGCDRLSIGAVARRPSTAGVPTRTGGARWHRATVWDMLKNPAYTGAAAYGRTRAGPWQPRSLRPQRGKSAEPRRAVTMQPVPPAEWITLSVPPLVDAALFDAVQEQLRENQRRARERAQGARYLLQGLVVCGRCRYALSGMRTVYRTRAGDERVRRYYRCLGTDAYRFGGERVCDNPPVLLEALDAAVWAEVRALLEDPARVEREHERRRDALLSATPQADSHATAAQATKLRQGLARLIDSYAEGLILKEEFAPRLERLRKRISALDEQARQEADEATARQDLQLVIGRLDEFAAKVRAGLADADWPLRREIIRTLVKRVEVTSEHINVVFRVGPGPLRPPHAAAAETSQDRLPRLRVAGREGGASDTDGLLGDRTDRLGLQGHRLLPLYAAQARPKWKPIMSIASPGLGTLPNWAPVSLLMRRSGDRLPIWRSSLPAEGGLVPPC